MGFQVIPLGSKYPLKLALKYPFHFMYLYLWQITVVYLIKNYNAMGEVNIYGCFLFTESKVSNHIGRHIQREWSRLKSVHSLIFHRIIE